jgi:lipoprotein-releasing system permease protein
VSVKGVDEHFPLVSNVSKRLIRGKFLLGDADKPALVMGVGVENTIGVASDRAILPLTVYLPRRGASTSELTDPLQSLSADNAAAAGAFAIQQDFDNNYVITNLGFVKRMMGLDSNEYGAADISVDNTEASVQVKKELEQLLGKQYKVQTMYEQNQSLYSAMRGEKWFIFVVLTFVLVVAAFTMIGALTMLVLEKQKDIQILKAMGSTNSRVQGIFLNEGLVLGVIGSAGGVLLALLIGWLQLKFKLIKLEGSTFLIDHYPVKFLASDILLVFFTVICIALLASWFPARKAAAEPMTLKSS